MLKLASAVTLVVVAFVSCAPLAQAARKPTKREAKAMKRVAMKHCRRHDIPRYCKATEAARVSTANPRYGYADVVGNHSSRRYLKRNTPRSTRWRVVTFVGGGIPACEEMRDAMPRNVLRDLRVTGWEQYVGIVRCAARPSK